MTNPYAPPRIVSREETKFRVRSSVKSSTSFVKVGLVCAFISGVILEVTVAKDPFIDSISASLLPGLVLGLGVFYATWKNVPHARPVGLAVFPLMAIGAFALLGMCFDSRPRFGSVWPALDFCAASFPGVVLMALGCLLIARPRSYSRFVTFLVVITMITGVAAQCAFNPPQWLANFPRYLLVMMFAQATMFGMIGWIFGDAISESMSEPTPSDQQSEIRET
jgi:hypothetical protein